MPIVNNRIKERRKELNLSLADLEEATGISIRQINRLEKGERRLNVDNMAVLAKALKLQHPQDLLIKEKIQIPVRGIAGAGGEIFTNDYEEHTARALVESEVPDFNGDVVDVPPELDPEGIVAVRIQGDSMFPVFQDGWIVYYSERCNIDIPRIKQGFQVNYNSQESDAMSEFFGKPCVVKMKDGRTMIKTLKRGSHTGKYNLTSYNAPDIENVELEWAAKIVFIKIN